MRKLPFLFFLIIGFFFLGFNIHQGVTASNSCGKGEETGCIFTYCRTDQTEWGKRESCFPMKNWFVCGCTDCQGLSGQRCRDDSKNYAIKAMAQATSTPVPTRIPSASPTPLLIQFMGIKLSTFKPDQPLSIISIIIRNIFGI